MFNRATRNQHQRAHEHGTFQHIQENRHIIKCCAECIVFCGRQCIALTGDVERVNMPSNLGNFLAILMLLATHDPMFKAHLETPHRKNPTYISLHILK